MRDPNVAFQRIVDGKPFNTELKLYSEKYINRLIDYYLGEEEYEKCHILKTWSETRFKHSQKTPI